MHFTERIKIATATLTKVHGIMAWQAIVAHDDFCHVYNDKDARCDCNPTITMEGAGKKYAVDADGYIKDITKREVPK